MKTATKRQKKRYGFKPGSRLPGDDAAKVGKRLEKLAGRGQAVTARRVLQDAEDGGSPLHDLFEWNDSRAADAHRMEQARHLLRSITVVIEGGDEDAAPVRLFVHIQPEPDEERTYLSTAKILGDAELRARLLRQALSEAKSWRQRYEELEELTGVFAALDKVKSRRTG